MEQNELATINVESNLAIANDKVLDNMTKATEFLPRLQLMTSNSKACKSEKVPVNQFALVQGEDYKVLGRNVDVLVIAMRTKALDISDEENIITIYDPKADEAGNPSGEFKRIMEKSENPESGCMFGPEFLIWVSGVGKFATFFLGSKSQRREAAAIRGLLKQPCTLSPAYIEGKKFQWYVPRGTVCSTPISPMPTMEEVMKELESFLNPTESSVEHAPSTGERAR